MIQHTKKVTSLCKSPKEHNTALGSVWLDGNWQGTQAATRYLETHALLSIKTCRKHYYLAEDKEKVSELSRFYTQLEGHLQLLFCLNDRK